MIHEAAFRNRFSLTATKQAAQRANGRHKLHLLDEAITLYLNGSAGTRSGPEVAFLSMLKFAGITKPLVNTKIGDIEVDFHWPDRRLVVEIDGPGHAARARNARMQDETLRSEPLAGPSSESRPMTLSSGPSGYLEVIGCASP